MAVIGVGVDIVEVRRFGETRVPRGFFERVFTDDEIAYCRSCARPEQHFAARFAAKEAAFKATSGFMSGLMITQVEVVRDRLTGAPVLVLVPNRSGRMPPMSRPDVVLTVSLSHCREYAVATVVAESEGSVTPFGF